MTSKKALTPLEEAVLGGFVADAATLPLHWHYDVSAMKTLLEKEGKIKSPEFLNPMQTKFYKAADFPGHYELGQLSCYSEQSVMTLEYFESTKGKYLGAESFSKFMYEWFKKYTGRPDHPTKDFLERAKKQEEAGKPLYPDAGADDKQTMHTFKIPVIALLLLKGDEKSYLSAVNEMSRAHQNTDRVENFGKAYALMLKQLTQGQKLLDVVEAMIKGTIVVADEVKEALEFVVKAKGKAKIDEAGWDAGLQEWGVELSHWVFQKTPGGDEKFKDISGLTCQFPGSFMVSLKVVLDALETISEAEFEKDGFAFGIRRNILFGGDNCGRTFTIAPLLVLSGAKVPEQWIAKMNKKDFEGYTELVKNVASY